MKVCCMQPAFIPPASYFRLFAASDVFVVLDDVQFDRRWYTHRQQLTNRQGKKEWLTLPVKKTPRDTTMIRDIKWAEIIDKKCDKCGAFPQDARKRKWHKELRKFPLFDELNKPIFLVEDLMAWGSPLAAALWNINELLKLLNIECDMEYSSQIKISPDLRGQDRIIAICKKLGATTYINSPGGRDLYDEAAFAKEGIKLTFLPNWIGSYDSILERLAHEKPEDIRREIYEQI